jgi:hypothetical protein
MPQFTEPAVMVRLGPGDVGQRRRETYHAAAHRSELTLNAWARQQLDLAACQQLPPPHVDDPPAEFCDE